MTTPRPAAARGPRHLEWELYWWGLTGTCWCHGFTDKQLQAFAREEHARSIVDVKVARAAPGNPR